MREKQDGAKSRHTLGAAKGRLGTSLTLREGHASDTGSGAKESGTVDETGHTHGRLKLGSDARRCLESALVEPC